MEVTRNTPAAQSAWKRAGIAGVVATSATALTLGMTAPTAEAALATADVNVINTGQLFDLLNPFMLQQMGKDLNQIVNQTTMDQVTKALNQLAPGAVSSLLTSMADIVMHSQTVPNQAVALFNALNAVAYTNANVGLLPILTPKVRTATTMAMSYGTGNVPLIKAYQALQAAAGGHPQDGFGSFATTSGRQTRMNLIMMMIQNPTHAGGIPDRFPQLWEQFGLSSRATSGVSQSGSSSSGSWFNGTVMDINWAYDAMTDFPVVNSPLAILNSIMAILPLNLLTPQLMKAAQSGDLGVLPPMMEGDKISDVVSDLFNNLSKEGVALGLMPLGGSGPGGNYHLTMTTENLPILELLRLPSQLINLATGLHIPTPIADALQPALRILINIAYPDVVTPADLENPNSPYYHSTVYKAYDRTYEPTSESLAFGSMNPLTDDERAQAKVDAQAALALGMQLATAEITAGLQGVVDNVRNFFVDQVTAVQGKVQGAIDSLHAAVQQVVDQLQTAVNGVIHKVNSVVQNVTASVQGAVHNVGASVQSVVNNVNASIQTAAQNLNASVQGVATNVHTTIAQLTAAVQDALRRLNEALHPGGTPSDDPAQVPNSMAVSLAAAPDVPGIDGADRKAQRSSARLVPVKSHGGKLVADTDTDDSAKRGRHARHADDADTTSEQKQGRRDARHRDGGKSSDGTRSGGAHRKGDHAKDGTKQNQKQPKHAHTS